MAYTAVPTKSTGDAAYTASDINTYIKNNWLAGVPDIFTAAGQLCYASAADTAAALAAGTTGYVLKSTGSLPSWAVHPAKDPVTTKGDILAATAADTLARVGVAGNGSRLSADSSQTAGVIFKSNAAVRSSSFNTVPLTSGTYYALWNAEDFDIESKFWYGTLYDNAYFTVPYTGYYWISCFIGLDASNSWAETESIYLRVLDDTTSTTMSFIGAKHAMASSAGGAFGTSVSGSDILYLTVDHVIYVSIVQASGANGAVTSGLSNLSIIRLGV